MSNKDIKKLRENLTLDFNQRPSEKILITSELIERSLSKANNLPRTCQLTTPDVDKLALTTPEVAELLAHSNSIQLQTFTRNCDSAEEEKPSKQAIQLWTNTVQNKNSPIKVKKVANNTASLPDAKPMQPINMQDQEMAKLERKRLRNRIAASKCRQRKLERISKLQKKVDELKYRNGELTKYANLLIDVNNKLLMQLSNHQDFGCSDLKMS